MKEKKNDLNINIFFYKTKYYSIVIVFFLLSYEQRF